MKHEYTPVFIDRPFYSRYQYKGFWIEIFFENNFELAIGHELSGWYASIELPNNGGCISTGMLCDRENAEFAAEELIDSWN